MAKKRRRAKPEGHEHDDVVIDTNVISHADNAEMPEHLNSLEFLIWVFESGRCCALDDNGKSAPLLETSLLWSEYNATLSPANPAWFLVQQMAASERVCFSDRPGQQLREKIAKLIPNNAKDRVVLGAAANCGSRWLVSNDEADFSPDVRDECRDQLNVEVTWPDERVA